MKLRLVAVAVSLVAGAPASTALASHEGSLFDDTPEVSARVYDRNERALERFWNEVDALLGSRVGHESEYNHDITAVRIEVGAVGMTEAQRDRLHAAAPPFVDLRAFRTRYSIGDLEDLGYRAERILREASMGELWGGFAYLDVPDRITVLLRRADLWAPEILRRELPDAAFRIEGGTVTLLPYFQEPPQPPPWRGILTLVAVLSTGGLRRFRLRVAPRPLASTTR